MLYLSQNGFVQAGLNENRFGLDIDGELAGLFQLGRVFGCVRVLHTSGLRRRLTKRLRGRDHHKVLVSSAVARPSTNS
jgi:hypothetical protein